ncbi:MAG: biotin carboxylase [Candidatus Saccharibacteria bacterium]|nr:biotin carboxylase [Candidatus Saccharibacteria bacterium]
MAKFLILGQNYSPLVGKIQARGDDYILLQDSSTQFSSKIDVSRCIKVDFKDPASAIETAGHLRGEIDGVVTLYEQYVLPLARIAHSLSLPAPDIQTAEACTDKLLMRRRFAAADEQISPAFAEVKDEDSLLEFAAAHGYPLIIKPVHLSKSLLIMRCDSKQELIENYRNIKRQIGEAYSKYAVARQPQLLVEEFMEGPQYSTDAFVDADGRIHMIDCIARLQTGHDIGYGDNFIYSRQFSDDLAAELRQQIFHVSAMGISALGIKSAPAFIQLVLTKQGPRIIEIAARNGGYRERMYQLAMGIDLLGNTLELALGHGVNIRPVKNEPCAVLELFPKKAGIFAGIRAEQELRALPSLQYLSIKATAGSPIGKSSDGYKMTAVIVLHHQDRGQFAHDLEFINRNVFVETV